MIKIWCSWYGMQEMEGKEVVWKDREVEISRVLVFSTQFQAMVENFLVTIQNPRTQVEEKQRRVIEVLKRYNAEMKETLDKYHVVINGRDAEYRRVKAQLRDIAVKFNEKVTGQREAVRREKELKEQIEGINRKMEGLEEAIRVKDVEIVKVEGKYQRIKVELELQMVRIREEERAKNETTVEEVVIEIKDVEIQTERVEPVTIFKVDEETQRKIQFQAGEIERLNAMVTRLESQIQCTQQSPVCTTHESQIASLRSLIATLEARLSSQTQYEIETTEIQLVDVEIQTQVYSPDESLLLSIQQKTLEINRLESVIASYKQIITRPDLDQPSSQPVDKDTSQFVAILKARTQQPAIKDPPNLPISASVQTESQLTRSIDTHIIPNLSLLISQSSRTQQGQHVVGHLPQMFMQIQSEQIPQSTLIYSPFFISQIANSPTHLPSITDNLITPSPLQNFFVIESHPSNLSLFFICDDPPPQ